MIYKYWEEEIYPIVVSYIYTEIVAIYQIFMGDSMRATIPEGKR